MVTERHVWWSAGWGGLRVNGIWVDTHDGRAVCIVLGLDHPHSAVNATRGAIALVPFESVHVDEGHLP